jgi:hypothetical protein
LNRSLLNMAIPPQVCVFMIGRPTATRILKETDRKGRPHNTQDVCHDGEVIERNNRSGCSHITRRKTLQLTSWPHRNRLFNHLVNGLC